MYRQSLQQFFREAVPETHLASSEVSHLKTYKPYGLATNMNLLRARANPILSRRPDQRYAFRAFWSRPRPTALVSLAGECLDIHFQKSTPTARMNPPGTRRCRQRVALSGRFRDYRIDALMTNMGRVVPLQHSETMSGFARPAPESGPAAYRPSAPKAAPVQSPVG